MALGKNVQTGRNFRAGRSAIISAPHSLTFGHNVSVGPRSVIQVDGQMGNFLMVGMNVHIVGRDDHAIDEIGTPMLFSTWSGDREPRDTDFVTIGDDVWIGASATVLSGVTIGSGAVIGAGAVVINDVSPFGVAVGVPAREVSKRFDDQEQRDRHLALLAEWDEAQSLSTTSNQVG
ncbi:acetyltransferase [Williamsia sp. 1138]|nr:acetyltransferase [Williamsia sp. 1138]